MSCREIIKRNFRFVFSDKQRLLGIAVYSIYTYLVLKRARVEVAYFLKIIKEFV